jgi:hypothetical protein
LRQNVRLDVTPIDQLSVIRLNSTFLETADKWYGWKGFTTAFAVTVLLMFFSAFGIIAYDGVLKLTGIVPTRSSTQGLATTLIFFSVLVFLIGWGMFSLLRTESFRIGRVVAASNIGTRAKTKPPGRSIAARFSTPARTAWAMARIHCAA